MYIFAKARVVNSEESGLRPRLSISYSSTNRYNAMIHGCNTVICSRTQAILCHYEYHPVFVYTLTEAGKERGSDFENYVKTLHPLFIDEESSSSLT